MMATNHKKLGLREIIRVYEKLVLEDKVHKYGSAFQRLMKLKRILNNRKRWVSHKYNWRICLEIRCRINTLARK